MEGSPSQHPNPDQEKKKQLWRRKEQGDSFTDEGFLQDLILNANVPVRNYNIVVQNSAAIAQQICFVSMSCCVPAYLRIGWLSAENLIIISVLMLASSYLFCIYKGKHILCGSIQHGVRQLCLLGLGVWFMSPLLSTLTATISGDSIVTCTTILLMLHLLLHDYNFVNSLTDGLTGSVSLASGIGGTLLLASRMDQHNEVFGYVLFSLEMYLLLPYVRRYLRQLSLVVYLWSTVAIALLTTALVMKISYLLGALCVASLIVVCFLSPYILLSIHKFKAKINGPWDEAVAKLINHRQGMAI